MNKVQVSFAKDADLTLVRSQLEKLVEEHPEVEEFHHCFLPRHVVVAKGFNTDVVDMLDEVLGFKQYSHLAEYTALEDCIKNIEIKRTLIAKTVDAMYVLGTDIAPGLKVEIEEASLSGKLVKII